MKKPFNLQLLPLVILAALTPACVMDSVDNSSFVFDWEVRDVGPNGQLVLCADAGVTTVQLVANNFSTNTTYTYDFACENLGGQTPVLPSGQYGVTLRLLRADGVEVSSLALPFAGQSLYTINPRRVTYIGAVIFEIQSLSAQWEIVRTAGPAKVVLTCAQVGAATVELTATIAGLPPNVFNFPCADDLGFQQGITQAVPVGTYNVGLRLLGPTGLPLSEWPLFEFTTPNTLPAVLPLVTFVVP